MGTCPSSIAVRPPQKIPAVTVLEPPLQEGYLGLHGQTQEPPFFFLFFVLYSVKGQWDQIPRSPALSLAQMTAVILEL